jgi:hypothetical protein
MDSQKLFENHVSKKDKEAFIKAIGVIEILRQDELDQKLVDAGKESRIAQAKAACEARKLKREQKINKNSAHNECN